MTVNEIINTGKLLYDRHLTVSTSGNISTRTPEGIYITATGTALGCLTPDDIVLCDFEGNEKSKGRASSEKKLHVEIYKKRPDVTAVIHVHPVCLTSFAACGKSLDEPLMSENILYFDDIPVAPYAMPSSDKLAEITSEYARNRDVILMANHGVIALAENMTKAFQKIETAEYYAQVVLNTKIIGNPKYLSQADIEDLHNLKQKLKSV